QMSGFSNGVSRRHGEVARRMWGYVWPGVPEEQVPITSITNGIHVPTWIAPEMRQLYAKFLGPDWVTRHDDPAMWERIGDIPDHLRRQGPPRRRARQVLHPPGLLPRQGPRLRRPYCLCGRV